MQTAFLIIISLAGTGYAFWAKQFKVATGFLIFAIAFTLTIPDIVSGFWVEILMALSIIIFAIGVFVIIYKKNENKITSEDSEEKSDKANKADKEKDDTK